MKTPYKILIFIFFLTGITILGWQITRKLQKGIYFGEEYIGMNKNQILKEFGEPNDSKSLNINQYDDDLKFFFEYFTNECNQNETVNYLHYDKFIFSYDFWLKDDEKGNGIVVLVK